MVSKKAGDQIAAILLKYVKKDDIVKMITELKQVDGNKSYRDTIALLERIVK